MKARAWMCVLWPAFLLACAAEWVVFAMVDPTELHWRSDALGQSRQGIYTAGFFVFWLLASVSSALTLWLARTKEEPSSPAD